MSYVDWLSDEENNVENSAKNNDIEITTDSTAYTVVEIKKENSWYFIYLERNDSLFKVISYDPSGLKTLKQFRKIEKNKRYKFSLKSYKDNLIINGVNVWPMGYSGGVQLDTATIVYLEPENGIWDLYDTDDLKGLHYLKEMVK